MMRDSNFRKWLKDTLRMPQLGTNTFNRMPFPPNGFRGGSPPFPGNKMRPPRGMRPPFSDSIPDIYVPANITFNGQKWNCAGFRFKGNSSLMMSWSQGIKKMPFRLNFSKFGDSIPELKEQRFYGFKELSFSNNNADNTFMHEKIASDLFREAGIKTPFTAFYEVYIDLGGGPIYFGLYTAIEIVENTMLKSQFGSDKGNCYKPDGQAGTFAEGTFDKKSLKMKNNKKKANFNDVFKLYSVLNSPLRTSDNKQWKAQLDSIFDIPVFIKWLAVNTTIQNWDTYGSMSHNYYLYNNPSTKKLTWIPWDNNEALNSGRGRELSFSLSEVTSDWPLIRYILDQPEYYDLYKTEIKIFIANVFDTARVRDKIESCYKLIYPYATAEKEGYSVVPKNNNISEAKNDLIKHIEKRYDEALNFIKKSKAADIINSKN
jgi:spore coat protein CotH